MPNKSRAFVIKPLFTNFNSTTLQYLDVLTYVSVRSFDNLEDGCFPAYETIAERARLSRTFVIQSLKRLQKYDYIEIVQRGYREKNRRFPNLYSFAKCETFNQIPLDFFEITDLTANEKAMLLLLVQFRIAPNQISGTIKNFAEYLGLTYNVISKQYKSLLKKGFLELSSSKSVANLARIDWFYPENFPNIKFTEEIDYNIELEMLLMDIPSPNVIKSKTVKSEDIILKMA